MYRDSEVTDTLGGRGNQVQEGFPGELALKEEQQWACREDTDMRSQSNPQT